MTLNKLKPQVTYEKIRSIVDGRRVIIFERILREIEQHANEGLDSMRISLKDCVDDKIITEYEAELTARGFGAIRYGDTLVIDWLPKEESGDDTSEDGEDNEEPSDDTATETEGSESERTDNEESTTST